jgi:hypothetical protein
VTDTAAPQGTTTSTPRVDPQQPDLDPSAPASTADIANAGRPSATDDMAPAPSATDDAAPAPSEPGATPPAPAAANGTGRAQLFDEAATGDLRRRWDGIQTGFVDEPRGAVEQADALVAECMQRLADTFARERQGLEQQWSRGDDVSTEDLRVALRRYRSFFDRLLAL